MANIGMVVGLYDNNPALFALLYRLHGYRLHGDIDYAALQIRKAGYGEPKQVVDINEQVLALNNARWYDMYAVTNQASWHCSADIHQQMTAYLQSISDAVISDPRLCYTLPLWQSALHHTGHDVFVVIPYTHPLTFAHHMHQQHHMSTQLALALWVVYTLAIINHTRAMPRLLVAHTALIHDWRTACQPLIDRIAPNGLAPSIVKQVDAYVQMRNHTSHKPPIVSEAIHHMPITQLAQSVYDAINQPTLNEVVLTTLANQCTAEITQPTYLHDVGQFEMVYHDIFLDTEARIRELRTQHAAEMHRQHHEMSDKIRLLYEEHSQKITMLYEKHGKYIQHQSEKFAETLALHDQQLAHMQQTFTQEIQHLNDKITTMQTEISWRTDVTNQQQHLLNQLGWALRILALKKRIWRQP